MNYIEEITKIARQNINKAENAGCGMYNFWIKMSSFRGVNYNDGVCFQVYPYKNNDYYGYMYLLMYIPIEGKKDEYEHEDVLFDNMTQEEQKQIYQAFCEQIGSKQKLSAFVKKNITFEEKIDLIMRWEEDRGSDGEYVYDLDNSTDAISWIELYGVKVLHKCREIGRYWLGGWQFSCFGENEKQGREDAWCIREREADKFLDMVVYDDIEERFNNWLDVEDFSSIYGDLIDFKKFNNQSKEVKYKWEAESDDGSYNETSDKTFETEKECYEDMRRVALEKMKWNTQYEEDFDHKEEVIHYDVEFKQNEIKHISYSGKYTYKIIEVID